MTDTIDLVDDTDTDTAPEQSTGAVPVPALLPTADVVALLQAINAELSAQFKERRSIIHAMTLAVLAKEHAFILGPPGTAKSMLTREFFGRFTGAKYFEAILSKTRPAEAILGPYNIPELRDHGHLFRKYKGHLPDCHFAMLDEIGKMSPTLGHDLLAVVNERRLHQVNGGRSWIECPLYTFVGGSNELPTEESDDAAAMWDRMLVRATVDYIQETGNFTDMLIGAGSVGTTTVDFESLANVIDNVVPNVPIPTDVLEVIVALRTELRKKEIEPSDRRWRQSMKILQASAVLAGRAQVDVADVENLRYTLWETPMQIQPVERATLGVSNPMAEVALELLAKAEEIAAQVRDSEGLAVKDRTTLAVQLNGNLRTLTAEVLAVRQKAQAAGASTTKLDDVHNRVSAIKKQVQSEMLGIDFD